MITRLRTALTSACLTRRRWSQRSRTWSRSRELHYRYARAAVVRRCVSSESCPRRWAVPGSNGRPPACRARASDLARVGRLNVPARLGEPVAHPDRAAHHLQASPHLGSSSTSRPARPRRPAQPPTGDRPVRLLRAPRRASIRPVDSSDSRVCERPARRQSDDRNGRAAGVPSPADAACGNRAVRLNGGPPGADKLALGNAVRR